MMLINLDDQHKSTLTKTIKNIVKHTWHLLIHIIKVLRQIVQKCMLIVITCHLVILDDLVKKDMPIIILDNLTKNYKTHFITH
jgi:hypothetical protein